MEITARMRMILKQIPCGGGYITSARIARRVGLSEKTVRTVIKELNGLLKNAGAEIQAKTRVGYTLVIRDEELFRNLQESAKEEPEKLPDRADERVQYLLWLLLNRTEYIKMDELCEFLYISRPTLSHDICRVEQILNAYSIVIDRRPNYGILIQGKELDIRNCMIHRVLGDLEHGIAEYRGKYQKELSRIQDILYENVHRYCSHLSQIVLHDLTVSVFVTLRRIRRMCFVPLCMDDIFQDVSEEIFSAAKDIADTMEAEFQIKIPGSEISYIAIHLAGKCNYDAFAGECCQMVPAFVDELADEMLQVVYETFRIDVRRNLNLRMYLVQHLFPVTIRLKYHILVKNDLKDEIRKKYSFAYAVASQAVIPLKIKYQGEISEDEIAYFAVLFALALEQEKEKIRKQNILIICAAGMSSARLLAYQYKKEFEEFVDEVYCCDMYSIDQVDFSRIDYIFTTVPLKKRLPKPVMEIREFLKRKEIDDVKNTLALGAWNVVSHYYREDLFFTDIEGNSKEEVIRELCRRVNEKHPLPKGFYQAVLKREKLASTDFGNYVAFPHPYKTMTKDTVVCVGILNRPVCWVRNKVQVVVLVSISATENRELQTFYQMTTGLMQDEKGIQELIAQPDFITFTRLLCQKRD